MPAIFAQVGGDSMGAGGFADTRGLQRIGLTAAPRLSQSRDVVDVYVQPLAGRSHFPGGWFGFPRSMEPHVRKFILTSTLVFSAVACATAPASRPASGTMGSGGVSGALAPRLAVDAFLDAVRVEDIQAMGALFGTSRGALRDTGGSPSNELEKRLIILQCYLAHDSYRIVSEGPGDGASRMIRVELTRGNMKRQPALFAVQGPAGRWYVENVELAAVRDFCGLPPTTGS